MVEVITDQLKYFNGLLNFIPRDPDTELNYGWRPIGSTASGVYFGSTGSLLQDKKIPNEFFVEAHVMGIKMFAYAIVLDDDCSEEEVNEAKKAAFCGVLSAIILAGINNAYVGYIDRKERLN